jgi:hypothetical protein
VTCGVSAGIKAGFVMDSFDFNSSVLALIVVLVSSARLVQVLFATLRICVQEYYAFRRWLMDVRRQGGADP